MSFFSTNGLQDSILITVSFNQNLNFPKYVPFLKWSFHTNSSNCWPSNDYWNLGRLLVEEASKLSQISNFLHSELISIKSRPNIMEEINKNWHFIVDLLFVVDILRFPPTKVKLFQSKYSQWVEYSLRYIAVQLLFRNLK